LSAQNDYTKQKTFRKNLMELLTIVHARKIDYLPIIYEFTGKITRHILFHDHDKIERDYAYELKASIENFNKKYNIETEIAMIEIDEDSKKDMQRIAEVFSGNSKEIYLNGAGADTALFTVLSSIVLRNEGHVVAYDNDDNTYNLISKDGFFNKKIENNMNLEDFLLLMGDIILEEQSKEEIVKQKEELELLFSDAKRMFNIRFLLKQRKTKELKKRYPKVIEALQKLDIVDEHSNMKGQEAFVHFGYLFEAFVYLHVEKFAFDDVKVGARIRFDEGQVERRNIEVSNEFDILTIKENKIGFIECKIGDSLDPLGSIYKSDSIMEYFGQSASSLIVNIERNKTPHKKKSKKNFGESLIYRAETKRVMIYNAFDFSTNKFRTKIKQAFNVELKEEHKKQFEKDGLKSLQDRWER